MTRPVVGAVLTTVTELDALPPYTVLLADPDGLSPFERDRCLSIQKRPGTPGYADYWHPSWDGDIFNAIASEEAVHRFGLGPFLVLWIPPVDPADKTST
jgi:hypothetical protein